MIETPSNTNSNNSIFDAYIMTEAWINATLGEELDIELPELVSQFDDGYHGWDNDPEILEAINRHAEAEYTEVSRDNVYNHEQDFESVFTFTAYAPINTDEWYYADDVYIAVSVHRGGDPRGNYAPASIYRVDCPEESGFFEWMIGWTIRDLEGNDLDPEGKFNAGYSQNPTCSLESELELDDDTDHWTNGKFHSTLAGTRVICTPSIHV